MEIFNIILSEVCHSITTIFSEYYVQQNDKVLN